MIEEDDEASVSYSLKYLKLVIKESLRLHPPGPVLPRASIEEQVINGYTIPAGAMVMVNNWAMQRDPRYWKDPERFEPERFETEDLNFIAGDCKYTPFGIGRRMCLGLTAVESALIQILYNFDWKLPKGLRAEDLGMTEMMDSQLQENNIYLWLSLHTNRSYTGRDGAKILY